MMPEFNLIDKNWIPCILTDGNVIELGIKEVFSRANEIREIFDSSPLVTLTLHRFLLAILHRVFGPESLDAWCKLWNAGEWDETRIDAYLDKWHNRFYLFDNDHPFYQDPSIEDAEGVPVTKMAHELASGNNATLFDHHHVDMNESWSPAKVTRYLIAYQAYAVAGGVNKPFNFADASLTRGIAIIMVAQELFRTLAMNLLVYNNETPVNGTGHDVPAWERDDRRVPDKKGTVVDGYLDLLTWQSRSIKIQQNDDGTCSKVQIQQYLKLAETGLHDPMKTYRSSETAGLVPLRFSADRAAWRDSHAILRLPVKEGDSSKSIRARVFDQLASLRKKKCMKEGFPPMRINTFGMGYGESIAKIDLWRRDIIPFDIDYVDQAELLSMLETCLSYTEKVGWIFRINAKEGASSMPFYVLGQALISLIGGGKAQKQEIEHIVDGLGAEKIFWSRIEVPFFEVFHEIGQILERGLDIEVFSDKILPVWNDNLKAIARESFKQATKSLVSGRGLKAVSKAEKIFNGYLNKILKLGNDTNQPTEAVDLEKAIE